MSLSIDHFEEEVHVLILERGREYFDAHQVLMLQQTTDGWSAVIEGSETYQVLLEGHDPITHWHCTCPFGHGPVCKHVAAALYAVREAVHVNRANASGEIDRWIDEADPATLRRMLKMAVRRHDAVRISIFHEMKPNIPDT